MSKIIKIMYTTYHLNSANDITSDIIDSIKATFKSKPITLVVDEDTSDTDYFMNNPIDKNLLIKSIEQDKNGDSISVILPKI